MEGMEAVPMWAVRRENGRDDLIVTALSDTRVAKIFDGGERTAYLPVGRKTSLPSSRSCPRENRKSEESECCAHTLLEIAGG